MRIGEPGEPFVVFAYELHLQEIYERANSVLDRNSFDDLEKIIVQPTKDFLKGFFENYYRSNKLDENNTVIIEPNDNLYESFLAISLSFYDPFKIELFLNHQREIYPENNFESLVEHGVYDYMKWWFDFDNSDRHERIMKWVVEAKKNPIKRKTKQVQKLEWEGELSVLKKLSKRLWKAKFTKLQADFTKVFLEAKPTQWKREPEYLCYLLFRLRDQEKPLFKADKGKGHYKVASKYFYEDSGKLVKKNYIADTIHNITERNPQNYDHIRKEIDPIIAQVLSGK